jgi:protein-disulfide isomerase
MSKRQEMRAKRAQQERTKNIVIVVIVAVIAIAIVAFVAVPSITTAFKPTETPKPEAEIKEHPLMNRPQVNINGMGDPNAPVKIIEYSDFQCPYCGQFTIDTEQQLIDAYIATGKVYFEYHSFGVFIGRESGRAAEAAYCAGDQNKFWEMHDILFANQTGENTGDFTDSRLTAFAKKLGLDMTAFNDCFTKNKYADRVTQDGVAGKQAGVQATPSFTINGKLVEGAQPFAAFQTEIDALLKK